MHKHQVAFLSLVLFAVAALVGGGCASNQGFGPQAPGPGGPASARHRRERRPNVGPSPTIKHVVIIIQENRSLNNIFGGPQPIHGADTQDYGYAGTGYVKLSKVEFETGPCDIDHKFESALTAINPTPGPFGTYQMNGFNQEPLTQCSSSGGPAGSYPYAYVDYKETKPYFFMAHHWVLADQYFPTELGPSFTGHLNLIAGTDEVRHYRAAVDFPSNFGADPGGCKSEYTPTVSMVILNRTIHNYDNFPCFWQFHTMADLLDQGQNGLIGESWRYYAPTVNSQNGNLWSEFDAIERVRCGTNVPITSECSGTGADWANIHTPSKSILTDIQNGVLANVTWVVPTYINSDHAGCNGFSSSGTPCEGPAWVASIVNAIGANSTLWDSTVIVVVWDDWGGWYDEVAPPDYDYRGKGIRTPMLVISPYTIQGTYYYGGGYGYVSHKQYEPGSILKFIENVFNLNSLSSLPCNSYYYYYYNCDVGYTDGTGTTAIGDNTLDFSQTPRPFTPVPTPSGININFFQRQTESLNPPDNE